MEMRPILCVLLTAFICCCYGGPAKDIAAIKTLLTAIFKKYKTEMADLRLSILCSITSVSP